MERTYSIIDAHIIYKMRGARKWKMNKFKRTKK